MEIIKFYNLLAGKFSLKAITLCLCLLLSGFGQAQSISGKIRPSPRYEHLFKTLPTIYKNDPEWVHLMYGASPNYYDIIDAYESYYRDHVFEKNLVGWIGDYWVGGSVSRCSVVSWSVDRLLVDLTKFFLIKLPA